MNKFLYFVLVSICGFSSFIFSIEEKTVEVEPRIKRTVSMVNKAADFLKKNTIERSAREFESKDKWFFGEIYIFVLDSNGTILVSGNDTSQIWKNLPTSIIKHERDAWKSISQAKTKGEWVNYEWKNGWKYSYVQRIKKGEEEYIVGAGFYPESKRFITERLVDEAVNTFYSQGPVKTWSDISNPFGSYVKGDIYVFAYDMNGVSVAHGDNPTLVGQNLIDMKSEDGKYIVRDILEAARSEKKQGWTEYNWKGAYKISFIRGVTDPDTGKSYAIGAGYYPKINEKTVIGLVQKAANNLRMAGSREALMNFSSNHPSSEFNYGPLGIFVYDLEGNVLVDAANPAFVGQNIIKRQDPQGVFVVREILDKLEKSDRGWVTYYSQNAYKLDYVELVETPDGKFVIGSGYYPASKAQTVTTLVQRAIEQLKHNNKYLSFNLFSDPNSQFYRGDVNLFIYTPRGTSLVNGDNKELVWDNFLEDKDNMRDQVVVDEVISLAKAGGGWFEYKTRNAVRRVYVKAFTKDIPISKNRIRKETFIVGSGYFL